MMRFNIYAEESYIRVVAIVYLVLASIGLATIPASNTFRADFWGLSGLQQNLGLVLTYFAIGAVAAIVGMLIGTPQPAYAATMIISPILLLLGLLGFISANYFGLLGRNVQVGDNILNLLIGASGLYIVITKRIKREGNAAQPRSYGMLYQLAMQIGRKRSC